MRMIIEARIEDSTGASEPIRLAEFERPDGDLKQLGLSLAEGRSLTYEAQRALVNVQAQVFVVEHGAGHIDDLAPFGDLSLRQWQRAVTAHALLRQWMMDRIGRFGDTFERRALVASLAARWLARRLAQRTRLLGQSIGRRRLARILASLVHLRLQRVQTRKQTQNERVLLLVREDGKVRSRWFLCHASMMNVSGTVYNLFIAAIAAEQSRVVIDNLVLFTYAGIHTKWKFQ